MKRLLMKWFPSYFTVNNHVTKFLNVDDLGPFDALKVIEVDKNSETITGGLGITDERAHELAKQVRIQFLECNNIVEIMVNMTSKYIKHPNESFFVAYQIANNMQRRNEPGIEGFLEFLKRKGQGGDQ